MRIRTASLKRRKIILGIIAVKWSKAIGFDALHAELFIAIPVDLLLLVIRKYRETAVFPRERKKAMIPKKGTRFERDT